MRRSLLAATVLALAASLLAGAPARADRLPAPEKTPGVSLTFPDTANFAQCWDHPYSYDFGIPADAPYYEVFVQITNSKGQQVASDFWNSDTAPGAGTGTWELCGNRLSPGTYTVSGDGKWNAAVGQGADFTLEPTTFRVRQADVKVTLTPSTRTPRWGQLVKLRLQVKHELHDGTYAPTPHARADLLTRWRKLYTGKWVRWGGFTTNGKGRAVYEYEVIGNEKKVRLKATLLKTNLLRGESEEVVLKIRRKRR